MKREKMGPFKKRIHQMNNRVFMVSLIGGIFLSIMTRSPLCMVASYAGYGLSVGIGYTVFETVARGTAKIGGLLIPGVIQMLVVLCLGHVLGNMVHVNMDRLFVLMCAAYLTALIVGFYTVPWITKKTGNYWPPPLTLEQMNERVTALEADINQRRLAASKRPPLQVGEKFNVLSFFNYLFIVGLLVTTFFGVCVGIPVTMSKVAPQNIQLFTPIREFVVGLVCAIMFFRKNGIVKAATNQLIPTLLIMATLETGWVIFVESFPPDVSIVSGVACFIGMYLGARFCVRAQPKEMETEIETTNAPP